MLRVTRTSRGFGLSRFKDSYGIDASLQESSAACENAIWFGCDKNAPRHHVTGEPLSPRMHLTQEQVRELLPYLKRFAKTGELGVPDGEE